MNAGSALTDRRHRVLAVAVVVAVVCVTCACATVGAPGFTKSPKTVMTPVELRAAVHARVPELEPEDVSVVFEVDAATTDRVRPTAVSAARDIDRIRQVVRFVTAEYGLGLRYDRGSLGTAAQTLERGMGNCMSLAAVLVGIARGLGWSAVFTEMSLRDEEIFYEADLAISEEHMGAKIKSGSATLFIDYSGRMTIRSRVRAISDLRATAQYYSNYAYELLHVSHSAGEAIPWEEVARRFEIATLIDPGFAQAWNNLGVARSRLGDIGGAEDAYATAIDLAGTLESASRNLRLLHGLPPEGEDAGQPGVPSSWEPLFDEP